MSSRYERASLIVPSNEPFGRRGEKFSRDDDVVAAAMINRLVHRAEVIALKGDSYRCETATSPASDPPEAESHHQRSGLDRT